MCKEIIKNIELAIWDNENNIMKSVQVSIELRFDGYMYDHQINIIEESIDQFNNGFILPNAMNPNDSFKKYFLIQNDNFKTYSDAYDALVNFLWNKCISDKVGAPYQIIIKEPRKTFRYKQMPLTNFFKLNNGGLKWKK